MLTRAESGGLRRRCQLGASGPHSVFGVDKASYHLGNGCVQAGTLESERITRIANRVTRRRHRHDDVSHRSAHLASVGGHRLHRVGARPAQVSLSVRVTTPSTVMCSAESQRAGTERSVPPEILATTSFMAASSRILGLIRSSTGAVLTPKRRWLGSVLATMSAMAPAAAAADTGVPATLCDIDPETSTARSRRRFVGVTFSTRRRMPRPMHRRPAGLVSSFLFPAPRVPPSRCCGRERWPWGAPANGAGVPSPTGARGRSWCCRRMGDNSRRV